MLICKPSAVVHSASAATGNLGFVGAGGADLSVVGDWDALLRKSPGSSLAYVQPVKSTHAAAMTVTSRCTAATPAILRSTASAGRGNIVTP